MYPEWGILQRERWPRRVADRSRFGIPGNRMEFKPKDRRRGADPPKKVSGMTGGVASLHDERYNSVNSGNDTCIGAMTSSKCSSPRPQRETRYTRLLCPSAATT